MKQRTASFLWFVGGGSVIALVLLVLLTRGQWAGWVADVRKPELPQAVNLNEVITAAGTNVSENGNTNVNEGFENSNTQVNTNEPEQIQIPAEFNLDIPFTSQAPFGNWDAAHEEYCEEASLLMANRFLQGKDITGPADADAAMNAIAAWEVERFGYFESTTAEETASVAAEYLGLEAVVLPYSYTAAQEALVNGRVVIIPAAGRELGNPNFTAPGPIYHMLVIKGWTEEYIITNDPGTRKGENYVYDPDVLFEAVGDYNHNDPSNGEKLMIVVGK
ncbi:MAG: C39 family peptidase [Patescibacteria group bacterium]